MVSATIHVSASHPPCFLPLCFSSSLLLFILVGGHRRPRAPAFHASRTVHACHLRCHEHILCHLLMCFRSSGFTSGFSPGERNYKTLQPQLSSVSSSALALNEPIEGKEMEYIIDKDERQCSCSACRSIYGGFVKLIMGKEENGSDVLQFI